MNGVKIRRVNGTRTYTVMEIDYWADPAKDEAWADRQRKLMPSNNAWRREYCRDWTTASGTAFYPEFAMQKERYIRPAVGLLADEPVVRSWDFGYRRPGVLWMQFARKSRRLWVLRELLPENLDTYSLRDLVLYLSGQRRFEDIAHRTRAVEWLRVLEAAGQPPAPWFAADTRFWDYSGPEALKVSASVEGEHANRTDAAILQSEGIHLEMFSSSLAAREQIVRRLLMVRADGQPGIWIDPSCRRLIEGMSGGIAFAQATALNPIPTGPRKDGYYEHLHDCLGYAVVNLIPARDEAEGDGSESISLFHEGVYGHD